MLLHPKIIDAAILPDFQRLKPCLASDPVWAHNEFAEAQFNDLRLTHRLQTLADQFVRQPVASIPQACGNWANSKAAYRFCANQKVSFQAILAPHSSRTLERVSASAASTILCPQDTTALSYFTHPQTQGLG